MIDGFIAGIDGPAPTPGLSEALSDDMIALVKDAHLDHLRMFFVGSPFADENEVEVTEEFSTRMDEIRLMIDKGLQVMMTTPLLGDSRPNPVTGEVETIRTLPEWMGSYDSDEFYDAVERMCEKLGAETRGLVTWWQVANEPDHPTYQGGLGHEKTIRFLLASGRGLKRGNPDAQIGIQLAGTTDEHFISHVHPYAKRLLEELYVDNPGVFDYIGIDGYFGSWSSGARLTSNWLSYIDDAHEFSGGLPVLINEFGYSTRQRGAPRTPEDRDRNFNSDICRQKDWDATSPEYKYKGLDHSEELQTDYVRESMAIFAAHPAVIGAFYFQLEDQEFCWQCGAPDCPAESAFGLVRTDGTPKPGYFAMRDMVKTVFTKGEQRDAIQATG